MYKHLKIFSDGGSRGNPGFAAIAFVVQSNKGCIQKTYSQFIGVNTNNQAEYKALIAAMQFASSKTEEITCYLDSELVVKQINGEYSVRNIKLRNLWEKVQDLRACFKKTTFISVPRSNIFIQRADALLNIKLDENI
ncbi:MAG: ribonuclease HI family protein [Candidatus Bathyarchaeota archaeon]|nr:ribonuclease HI family protein [Candidatus Bathyarchaeota archaeon]